MYMSTQGTGVVCVPGPDHTAADSGWGLLYSLQIDATPQLPMAPPKCEWIEELASGNQLTWIHMTKLLQVKY